jgi:hypothetical protein
VQSGICYILFCLGMGEQALTEYMMIARSEEEEEEEEEIE